MELCTAKAYHIFTWCDAFMDSTIMESFFGTKRSRLIPGTKLYFDLSESTTPTDKSGYGSTATGTNTTVTPTGQVFDGATSYMAVTPSTAVNIRTPPISIFSWVNVTSGAATGYIFSKNTSAATDMQFGHYYSNSDGKIYMNLDGSGTGRGNTTAISPNTWVMAGFVWDGVTIQPYLNGVPNGTSANIAAFTLTQTGAATNIGRRAPNNVLFNGSIGEIWLINRAPSSGEVFSLYTKTRMRYGV